MFVALRGRNRLTDINSSVKHRQRRIGELLLNASRKIAASRVWLLRTRRTALADSLRPLYGHSSAQIKTAESDGHKRQTTTKFSDQAHL